MKVIADNAFNCCENIKSVTLPETTVSIGNAAFHYCSDLQKIYIPASVEKIGEKFSDEEEAGAVFGDCKSLCAINVSPKNKYYTSVDGVLYSKKKDILFRCPPAGANKSFTVPKTVDIIGYGAFNMCRKLKTVIISDGAEIIENHSFNMCSSLKK